MSHTDLTPCTRVLASSGTVPIAEELLARVLEPYSCKGCRYLIDAQYSATEDSVLAYGNFTIGESAYIRSTGHFNAVELILCFNQLAYSAFARPSSTRKSGCFAAGRSTTTANTSSLAC